MCINICMYMYVCIYIYIYTYIYRYTTLFTNYELRTYNHNVFLVFFCLGGSTSYGTPAHSVSYSAWGARYGHG